MNTVGKGLVAIALSGLVGSAVPARETPGLADVELTLVDGEATGYATFQSHNQKIVSNENGIFMAHIRSRNEAYTAQQWRLSRSTDGGQSFTTVHEATHATNPAVLETDAHANIYLVRPDFNDGHAYLYRFLAADDYAEPIITKIPKGSAGKYCMIYDGERQQLYYFAWGRTFYIIGLDGEITHSRELCLSGENADPQYPHFSLDRQGVLHTAWTTVKQGEYLYWDIHYMASPDGGVNWEKMDGTPLEIPVRTDDSGRTDLISLEDEFEVHTWLSNFMLKDGKAHFVYLSQSTPYRQHYVRYDIETGTRELDIQPAFAGTDIALASLDGFFATRAHLPNAPLYCVLNSAGRIGCLASDDNGETWYDYALSAGSLNPYAIGGCRELSADGYILGAFTDFRLNDEGEDASQVHFLRIRAGQSRAEIALARREDGMYTVAFKQARGQPEQVRFRRGEWSDWIPFAPSLDLSMETPPTHFQLKSRLGIESEVFVIAGPTAIEAVAGDKNPRIFALAQNFPNPFNASTSIVFALPTKRASTLGVFDLGGRRVKTLVSGKVLDAGHYVVTWDGTDERGLAVSSGAYFCRLRAGDVALTRKMLLVK